MKRPKLPVPDEGILVIVVEGGEGTPDKPDVMLGTPANPNRFDAFMNIRVADIEAIHASSCQKTNEVAWSSSWRSARR